VTGAASGIGRATALRLASGGAAVAIDYVGQAEAADEVRAEAERRGARAVALEADVADEAEVRRLFAQAAEALGGHVDLLVNNAGVEAP